MNFKKNVRIKQMTLLATFLCSIGASYGCDNNKSSDKTPAPAAGKTCSGTGSGTKLALQSTSNNTLYIGYDKASENGRDVTSTYSIKAIMNKYCVSCHKAGGEKEDSPMTTYSQVKKLADAIISSVEDGSMPEGVNNSAGKTILPYLKAWKFSGATQAQPTKSATKTSTTNTKTNTSTGSGSSSTNSNQSSDDNNSSDGTLNNSPTNTNTKC